MCLRKRVLPQMHLLRLVSKTDMQPFYMTPAGWSEACLHCIIHSYGLLHWLWLSLWIVESH